MSLTKQPSSHHTALAAAFANAGITATQRLQDDLMTSSSTVIASSEIPNVARARQNDPVLQKQIEFGREQAKNDNNEEEDSMAPAGSSAGPRVHRAILNTAKEPEPKGLDPINTATFDMLVKAREAGEVISRVEMCRRMELLGYGSSMVYKHLKDWAEEGLLIRPEGYLTASPERYILTDTAERPAPGPRYHPRNRKVEAKGKTSKSVNSNQKSTSGAESTEEQTKALPVTPEEVDRMFTSLLKKMRDRPEKIAEIMMEHLNVKQTMKVYTEISAILGK